MTVMKKCISLDWVLSTVEKETTWEEEKGHWYSVFVDPEAVWQNLLNGMEINSDDAIYHLKENGKG